MKTLNFYSIFALFVAIFITGCSGSKETKKTITKNETGTILNIPCQDFQSNDNFFRATQLATSQDLSFSKEQALLLAKQRMASTIEGTLKSVTQRYTQEYTSGQDSEFGQKVQNITKDVVNQKLADVKVLCQKSAVLDDGKYRSYVAIEMDKKNILNEINNRISNDTKLRLDYDEMKFKEVFEKEMNQLKEERGF